MLENRQIAFVGAGAMGGAMISGVLARNVIEPGQIIAADPRRDVCDALHRKYGVSVTTNNIVACKDADVIVLSVKPQVLNEVYEGLSGSIRPDALVISIVAGAKLHTLVAGLNHKSIIRCMPNTPAQIGMGIHSLRAVDQNMLHEINEYNNGWLVKLGAFLPEVEINHV